MAKQCRCASCEKVMSIHTFYLNDTRSNLIAQEVLGKADLDAGKENSFI